VPPSVDVAVVGGGPAGATTARLLASIGHRVVLFHAESRRGVAVESLPPSALPIVESMALGPAFAASAVSAYPGNDVCWGGEVSGTTFDSPGLHIARTALDARLRFDATAAGVVVRSERATASVLRRLRPRVTVDATGRCGLVGARRIAPRGWRTLAIVGTFAEAFDDPRTTVESFDRGWVWTVPMGPGRRQVTISVDPPHGRGLTGASLGRFFEGELDRARRTRGRLAAARLQSVAAVDASPSIARHVATHGLLRVGDAACRVDPLSSFGIKKALAEARLAASVAHAMLTSRGTAPAARARYVRHVQADFAGAMAGAAAEAARAARAHSGTFWRKRRFPATS
jgi:flavin-dependent dehydrogenase